MRTCGSGRGYPVGWYEWNAGGRTVAGWQLRLQPSTHPTQTCVLFIRWSVELVELYTRPLERRAEYTV